MTNGWAGRRRDFPSSCRIATTDDALDEPAETMQVAISNPSNATLGGTTTGVGTLNDNDDPPAISITDASAVEGGSIVLPVSLSAASGKTITVDWTPANGTAVPADYTTTGGTVTFNPCETSKRLSSSVWCRQLSERSGQRVQQDQRGGVIARLSRSGGNDRVYPVAHAPVSSIACANHLDRVIAVARRTSSLTNTAGRQREFACYVAGRNAPRGRGG
jgi:hypothetical protein